jgi:hypothetical protein
LKVGTSPKGNVSHHNVAHSQPTFNKVNLGNALELETGSSKFESGLNPLKYDRVENDHEVIKQSL